MSNTLTIPPHVVPRLREGAHLQLARGADAIRHAAQAFEKDEPPLEGREEMERTWALLDVLGWAGAAPPPIELDMRRHSIALIAALDEIVPDLARWLSEMSDQDERRPSRKDEYQAMCEFEGAARRAAERLEHPTTDRALVIPGALLGRVREGAYGVLAAAADEIGRSAYTQVPPEPEIRPQLERAWDLLGRLGWTADNNAGTMLELSVEEHGSTLLTAVDIMTPLLSEWLDDLDPADPKRPATANELRLMHQFHARAQRAIQ
jgi:hypothetical protein